MGVYDDGHTRSEPLTLHAGDTQTSDAFRVIDANGSPVVAVGPGVGSPSLAVQQNDVANNPRGVDVSIAGTGHALRVVGNGNSATSSSVGGVVNFTNNGTGTLCVMYAGAASVNPCLYVRQDGAAQAATFESANGNGAGTGHVLTLNLKNSGNANASALNVISANSANSAMFLTGVESARGTLKITHTDPGAGADAAAAAISINLAGASTLAQGIFIDVAKGAAAGVFLTCRFNGTPQFEITAAGLPKWCVGTNVQATVGAAGAASALPATPAKYLKIVANDGNTYVIPAYNP